MSIKQVPIRATVKVGGVSVSTPYIVSFNVHRRRGAPATFDAAVKVNNKISGGGVGGGITITANGNKIFTGVVKGAKLTPCWDDPGYVILTVTGEDILSLLKGKKFTRRCRGTKSSFCVITDVVRSGLKSGKFAYINESAFQIEPGVTNMDLPSHGTNVDIKAIEGVGTASGDDKARGTVLFGVSLVSEKEEA